MVVCIFNDRGLCKFGRKCHFKHPKKNCEKNQSCDDTNCSKQHPKPCIYQDNCRFGVSCALSHEHPVELPHPTKLRTRSRRSLSQDVFSTQHNHEKYDLKLNSETESASEEEDDQSMLESDEDFSDEEIDDDEIDKETEI